ncbi:nuclease [Neisseria gonorrhoeae]|nr:nuclease [Neisseria gonorrhoeae]
MQIKKIMKWLPVALSLLGALGYTGYDSEAVRTAVAVLDVLGTAGDVGSDAPVPDGHRRNPATATQARCPSL